MSTYVAYIYDLILLRTQKKEFESKCLTLDEAFKQAVKLFSNSNERVMNVIKKTGE